MRVAIKDREVKYVVGRCGERRLHDNLANVRAFRFADEIKIGRIRHAREGAIKLRQLLGAHYLQFNAIFRFPF